MIFLCIAMMIAIAYESRRNQVGFILAIKKCVDGLLYDVRSGGYEHYAATKQVSVSLIVHERKSLDEMRTLINEAHAQGMRLVPQLTNMRHLMNVFAVTARLRHRLFIVLLARFALCAMLAAGYRCYRLGFRAAFLPIGGDDFWLSAMGGGMAALALLSWSKLLPQLSCVIPDGHMVEFWRGFICLEPSAHSPFRYELIDLVSKEWASGISLAEEKCQVVREKVTQMNEGVRERLTLLEDYVGIFELVGVGLTLVMLLCAPVLMSL